MIDATKFSGKRIAISVSDSPDLIKLGLSLQHVHQATAELAQFLLASGAHLIYGGDLRANGFTRTLFELAARYHNRSSDTKLMFTNYLPWATHMGKQGHELLSMQKDIEPYGRLVLLSSEGNEISVDTKKKIPRERPTATQWSECLTSMRNLTSDVADARILLGGSVAGFLGAMPGIAEEALITIGKNKPTFILGGFGGCANDILSAMNNTKNLNNRHWQGLSNFKKIRPNHLRTGLSQKQQEHMSESPFMEVIIPYLLNGLHVSLS